MRLRLLWWLLALGTLFAQPKRVLYFSHTAGFRHGSIDTARAMLETVAPDRWTLTASEDPAILTAASLKSFDAVFFFTSGEIPISDRQKQDLLEFVRNGGGFAATHSASDTFYTWPEYGELIGAWFDGHPWTQRVTVDVEDPNHPIVNHLAPSFSLLEEVYQHRAFDRANVRVLLTVDTLTIDVQAEGVNRRDDDFALAWVRNYGRGRVFYTAIGHFGENFTDPRLQPMFRKALEWVTGLIDGDATPRGGAGAPRPHVKSIVEAAQYGFPGALAPSAVVTIFGENLTSGSILGSPGAGRLAGTSVLIDGEKAPLIWASPSQVNLVTPAMLGSEPSVVVRAGVAASEPVALRRVPATPGIFAVLPNKPEVLLFCGGLSGDGLSVSINGEQASIVAVQIVMAGIYQVSVLPKTPVPGGATFVVSSGGASATYKLN